jgi:hypothetical protein
MSKADDTKYKKEKSAFTGVVKLASLLQKALETGKSSYVEMNEITRYVNYYVKTHVDDSCMYLDYMINKHNNGEAFGGLADELRSAFGDLSKIVCEGYEKLVAPNGNVNRALLDRLIQVDSEITSTVNMIRNTLMGAKNNGQMNKDDIKEISRMLMELAANANERKKIL